MKGNIGLGSLKGSKVALDRTGAAAKKPLPDLDFKSSSAVNDNKVPQGKQDTRINGMVT